ncbi:ribonuclease H-like domain-containing protein [Tanacetum coccineum]
MITRSKSGISKPISRLNLNVTTEPPLPRSHLYAMSDPNWLQAMIAEYDALISNGIDYFNTFSPVVKPETIRTVVSLALSKSWHIHKLDVKNAFLNETLSETVYMHQPPSFCDKQHPDYVCLLWKSLYGLKQAPRAWFQRFATFMMQLGFLHSRCDSLLFIYHHGASTAYLLLYMDDIILTASSQQLLDNIISRLQRRRMSSKLDAIGTPVANPTLYRSLAEALQYLTFTGPDIAYVVQQICLFMHDPREPYFHALKRVLRYIRGTLYLGLQLHATPTDALLAYSHADWGGCPSARRSTSGYCVFLVNNRISWSSKRQYTISWSSTEAEYRGVANDVAEKCWLRNLLRELHLPLRKATIVYCDNVSAVYLSSNPVQHQRTKHIEIDIHFVRDQVATGQLRVLHVPSSNQYADIFTKSLPSTLFYEFRDSLSVRSPSSP